MQVWEYHASIAFSLKHPSYSENEGVLSAEIELEKL